MSTRENFETRLWHFIFEENDSFGFCNVETQACHIKPEHIVQSTELGAHGKEHAWQCRIHKRCRFDPWIGKIPWITTQQPTPVFLLGEFHGQRSLVGYGLEGSKELDRTEVTEQALKLGKNVTGINNVKIPSQMFLLW